jgi:tetratricopeptide (TPR) repeat protein
MRKLLIVLLVLPLFVGGGTALYRVASRDYRYNELVKLGDGFLSDDLPLEAARAYAAAIALEPDEPIAYVKRADARRRQGDLAPAFADLEKASTLSNDVLLVSSRLAELCYESGRFDEAASHYQKILALDPDSPTILYKLGLVHFRAGHEAEAIEALNRAAALRAGFWQAYYLRGAVFRSLGGSDEAERDFRTALELAPEAGLARSALIELYLDENQPAKALPLVQSEIDSNPGAARPYLDLADVHRLAGRTADAIEAVGLALEQNPNLPAAYLRLGELWLDEASARDDAVAAEKALAALTNVVKMDPSNGAAALARGRAYLALGDEERGFAELQRASQATPVQAEALRLLGDLYRARRNPTEAVTAYHVYLKLSGDTPVVLERLGDAYVESGKPDVGARVYLKLADLEPRRVAPLMKAARALLLSGDGDAAARACRRGLAANPENRVLLDLLDEARRGRPHGPASPSTISP